MVTLNLIIPKNLSPENIAFLCFDESFTRNKFDLGPISPRDDCQLYKHISLICFCIKNVVKRTQLFPSRHFVCRVVGKSYRDIFLCRYDIF